ncbi:MAG: ABC transporter permease subunit [Desulfobacterales bacterium]|nr:ABC transporter permease subunit [Desulfobacterales bacterium]
MTTTTKDRALQSVLFSAAADCRTLARRGVERLRPLAIVLAIVAGVGLAGRHLGWIDAYPDSWIVPLKDWISAAMAWLLHECNLGLFTFKEMTRSISWLISWPLKGAQGLLYQGIDLSILGGSWRLPHLPWAAVVGIGALLGLSLQGWRLAAMTAGGLLYLVLFGQWESAMETLASVIIAVPLGALLGMVLGIISARTKTAEAAIRPVLDLMQTVPIFAYLVPILFLFGFGPVSAMIGTIIYAAPPMVRCTLMGLRSVPADVVESGLVSGCSRRQMLFKIFLPSALPEIMVGLNQVIMLSLNMVIIASMIGAGGLGYDVLNALRQLKIGRGLEAGLSIVVLAVILDRLSQAAARKSKMRERGIGWTRRKSLAAAAAVIILTGGASVLWDGFYVYPESWSVTTAPFWEGAMTWINLHFYDFFYGLRNLLLIYILMPVKKFLVELPWAGVVAALAFISYRLQGVRLLLVTVGLCLFITVTGYWEKAIITVYLCGIGALLSSLGGIFIGICAAGHRRLTGALNLLLDTLQTLPAFVYLMPCVILFRVGDVSALIAIVAYAVVPVIRYTLHGISQVPTPVLESSRISGCSKRQLLVKVQLPLALPDIVLGINQTIMMALSMVVITALIGTRDLGQEVYMALTKADIGRGLVAGVGVACIATVTDRLMQAYISAIKHKTGQTP